MPKVPAYIRGFGLKKGMVIEGYTLTSINIQHKKIKLFQEYGYPTTLTWAPTRTSPNGSSIFLIASLSKKLAGSKVIYTAYRNPYRCSFGHLEVKGKGESKTVIITSHGVCKRIKKSEV
jgi:hypothetical protein